MKETGLWGKSPSLPKSILSYLGPREGQAKPTRGGDGDSDGLSNPPGPSAHPPTPKALPQTPGTAKVSARGIELLPQAWEALLQSTVLGSKDAHCPLPTTVETHLPKPQTGTQLQPGHTTVLHTDQVTTWNLAPFPSACRPEGAPLGARVPSGTSMEPARQPAGQETLGPDEQGVPPVPSWTHHTAGLGPRPPEQKSEAATWGPGRLWVLGPHLVGRILAATWVGAGLPSH